MAEFAKFGEDEQLREVNLSNQHLSSGWGWGGGTYPGFGYPFENGPQEHWLSMQSKLEKGEAVIDSSTLRRAAVRGGPGLLQQGSSFWLL